MSDDDSGVFIPIPLPEKQVFRYQAADDILGLLYRNPHQEFTITQLRTITDHGGKSVDNAIEILSSLNLIHQEREGRHSLIRINREQVQKPDDPIAEIPQEEFRDPVKAFADRVEEDLGGNLVGILLFGSVSRGEADRASDIDIQVVVENDLLQSRREIQDIRQVMVESVDTAEQYGEKLQEIFSEAVTLYASDRLDELRQVILDG
jgi:predicted nucleotidyltransferase